MPIAIVVATALGGCGVSKSEFDAKVQEATAAKQEADAAKQQVAQLQTQVTNDDQQVAQLKGALGMAQSQAITDDQKQALDDAKRALQEAQDRGKLLDDLQTKFKKMIDAGHLKVTTRHGRIVLQLHNDVLFGTGEAELKPDGKQAIGEVAATLRGVSLKRFQVAGHTDSEPITTETKAKFPSNWELSEARAQPDITEKLQIARIPFWNAVDRVKRGEIRDSISVAALLRVALMALQGELPEQIARAIGR